MEAIFNDPAGRLILAAVLGYLIGSLSFARILTLLRTKSKHVEPINEPIPGSDLRFESNSISATVVSLNLGKKFGCLTAILDMVKVALPTLLISRLFTEHPFYLMTAAAGIAGHIYPLYHRFRGGRGESPMLGAMIIINWFGIFIANATSMVLAFLTGSTLVLRYGWYVVMIFWYWIYFKSIYHVSFMVVANFLFWFAMRQDLAKFWKLKDEEGLEVSEETVSDFLLMGKGPGRFLDSYGLPALLKKAFKKNGAP